MCPDHRNTWPSLPPTGISPAEEASPLVNARVFSHHGVVIDSQNLLRSDLSPDIRSDYACHRILNYDRLPPIVDLPKSVFLLAVPSSNKNYFHWLIESVPKLRHAPPEAVILTPLSRAFHGEAIAAAKISPERCIELTNSSHFRVKTLRALPLTPTTKADIDYLRQLFSPKKSEQPSQKIYISRSDTWRRRIRNEAALIKILENSDFEIHTLNGKTIRAQAALFSEASHIIAPHGAALANVVFAQKGTKFLELFASNYQYPHYEKLAQLCQLNYQKHISQTSDSDPDFDLDLRSFQAAIGNFL